MTNPANVIVIVEKLHAFLKTSVDVYLRTELVSKIIQLAERCVLWLVCLFLPSVKCVWFTLRVSKRIPAVFFMPLHFFPVL